MSARSSAVLLIRRSIVNASAPDLLIQFKSVLHLTDERLRINTRSLSFPPGSIKTLLTPGRFSVKLACFIQNKAWSIRSRSPDPTVCCMHEGVPMPYFVPGSSELTIAPPPVPTPAIVVDKLAELSADEPLPETYQANRIRLLAQSPRRLYLYWEFLRDPYETLRRAFRWQADRYKLVVRLVDLENGGETLHVASPTRSQWFNAQQGHSYRAD